MNTAIAIVALVVVALWLYMRLFSPRPEHAPLATDPDDPLLVAAVAQARASLHTFMQLVSAPHDNALVKLALTTSSGEIEHVWAELMDVLNERELRVRLVTPPVTHGGRLERVRTCTLDEVEDWHVRDAAGRLHGGYTQRAMFAIARRDGVKLPAELLAQERQYEGG